MLDELRLDLVDGALRRDLQGHALTTYRLDEHGEGALGLHLVFGGSKAYRYVGRNVLGRASL